VPRFLGFEARLVPSYVGAYRCMGQGCLVDLGCGDGGGLGFGGDAGGTRRMRLGFGVCTSAASTTSGRCSWRSAMGSGLSIVT
jgi:hypothetical protein